MTHVHSGEIATALTAWDDYCTSEGFRPSSRDQYRSIATRFLRWFEPWSTPLGEITPQQVECFLDDQNVIETTRVHYRGMLRRFFAALAWIAHQVSSPC